MRAGSAVFWEIFMENIYDTITAFETILTAYNSARMSKKYTGTVLRFTNYLESNLLRIQRELITESYMPSPYVYFKIHDPKERHVAAPAFRDRIVQHALVDYIEPLFDRHFIDDSYACRKKKGTHYGLKRTKRFLQAARSIYGASTPVYCLRFDIHKFFASVSWDMLLPMIFKEIKCPRTQTLIKKIITCHTCRNPRGYQVTIPENVVAPILRRGLPIGNLTSQLFANIYLNQLDQFVKQKLHVRWYGRYMDDFFILHPDKEYLIKKKKR